MTKVLGGVASDDYKIARDKFWELALETDEFKQCDFESEFEKLVTFVECAETDDNADAIIVFSFFFGALVVVSYAYITLQVLSRG